MLSIGEIGEKFKDYFLLVCALNAIYAEKFLIPFELKIIFKLLSTQQKTEYFVSVASFDVGKCVSIIIKLK